MNRFVGFFVGILIQGLIVTAGGISNPALAQGWPEVAPSSPEEFAAHIKSEIARFTKIAKAAGIKAE
jgi:tripartite-type tricarboxylate transporter receptor subunit TctC